MIRSLSCSLALVCLVAGCVQEEDVNSGDLRTSGMYAELTVTNSGDGTNLVVAVLRAGGSGGNTVQLTGGDKLVARSGTQELEMTDRGSSGHHEYTATLTGNTAGQEIIVALDRGGEGDAMASSVLLPAPLDLASPVEDAAFDRTDTLEVQWAPTAPDSMTFDLDGTCIRGTSVALPSDTGSYEVPDTALKVRTDSETAGTCRATITLTRTRNGTVDKAFGEGGSFEARQVRTVGIVIN